jgi:hypothetical protein
LALIPRPVLIACSTQYLFNTGSIPGIAASIRETWEFGSLPNSVAAPENNFALEATCAWTSRPITYSHFPVFPII